MALPVRVSGYDDGKLWSEMTRTEDLSGGGLAFYLKRPVALGEMLHLALPLPKRFRQYDLMDASYAIYAIVRNVGRQKSDAARVGVMFYGKHAPEGFDKGMKVLLPGDQVKPRQHARFEVKINVKLRRIETTHEPLEEWTVTENLSLGGALVPTSLSIMKGENVSLETADGVLKARASVQSLTIGKDNVPRLALAFEPAAEEAAREVLKRHGFPVPELGAPSPAPPKPVPAVQASSVRFARAEAFAECGAGKHGSCPGWGWEAVPRLLRLCRCSCHGG